MRIVSKIKSIFSADCIHDLASVCDTKRIPSNIQKMFLAAKVLLKYEIQFVVLGGATNRLVIQVGDYAIKIAVDQQGYKDNFMEYSICRELQPYVTKSYETNGYILVQECVRLMTDDEWVNRKGDILRILDALSHDYLLGDVGYIPKNRANWGLRDDGNVVILDYAYCHRATQKLFECEVCGDGILVYDQNYDFLMCNNREACHARFTYNERKRIQGDQVDLDMIDERKRESIVLGKDQTEKVVQTFSGTDIIDDENCIVVHNWGEYRKALEEGAIDMASIDYDNESDMKEVLGAVQNTPMDPEGETLLHEKWETNNNAERKRIVFAEDYVEPAEGVIAAKPTDMEYGESREDYEERKKQEARQEEDEMEGTTMTMPDTNEVKREEHYETLEDLIRAAKKRHMANNQYSDDDYISVDSELDEFGLPVFGKSVSVTQEEPQQTGKVYME